MGNGTSEQRQRIAVAHLRGRTAGRAATALTAQIRADLGPGPIDLALLFCSPQYEAELPEVALELQEQLGPRAFIGVSGESVVAGEHELEHESAIVLWAARLPGVGVRSFHLLREDLERLAEPGEMREHLGIPQEQAPTFILFAEPFSFAIPEFFPLIERAYPGRPCVGGVASAAETADRNYLVFEGHTLRRGLVGVALWGNVHVDTVVSQGCRPIGRHMVITSAERNVIRQLGGRPPLEVVHEMIDACPPRDVELMKQRGLLIGCVINEYQQKFAAGDFLIRNPIGFDRDSGALVVNDLVRIGQTVQFQVRDANSAAQDLSELLAEESGKPYAGGLLFTCNGRGTRLFASPHHDARAVVDACGSPPLAGFFCAGEIGPIGNRNFLHGHTAVVALFGPAQPKAAK